MESDTLMASTFDLIESAIDARDSFARGSSLRVIGYAEVIARHMDDSPTEPGAWARLERGAKFRDLGNIGVPDSALMKPGTLTEAEFATVKRHTLIGFDLLSGLTMLSDELVIVRSHHERYDGAGYPDRKMGDELPIFLWIISAADAIDAITSDRPFRGAASIEFAVDQVRRGAGKQFHPDVVTSVLDAANKGHLSLLPHE